MNKTIAILCSLDTKHRECAFVEQCVRAGGLDVFKVDLSTRAPSGHAAGADVSDVLRALGLTQEDVAGFGKSDWIDAMSRGLTRLMPLWYGEGKFHGAMAIGGLQNTVMSQRAIQALPLGVPKLIVSTVACGQRVLDGFMGNRDVMLMHAVADIAGLNPVTRTVLGNAAAAMVGMVKHGASPQMRCENLIGLSAMGVVGGCSARVLSILEGAGREVVCFHSTGKGGKSMEEMIASGDIASSVELSLHELVCEDVFGNGYAMGSPNRLCAAVEKGIPMVVTPGGLDFIDYSAADFENGPASIYKSRQHVYHNAGVVHIKVSAEEGRRAAQVVANRLNRSRGPVTVLLPMGGFRSDTRPGEALYNPEVDDAIRDTLSDSINARVRVERIDANMNDEPFAEAVAEALIRTESRD